MGSGQFLANGKSSKQGSIQQIIPKQNAGKVNVHPNGSHRFVVFSEFLVDLRHFTVDFHRLVGGADGEKDNQQK